MASTKARLKAVNESIKQSKFGEALKEAQSILETDPKSYQARIFSGFCFEKLGRLEDSEKAYLEAAKIQPKQPPAWQGLVKLYERQGPGRIPAYKGVVTELAKIYYDAEDLYKCQVVVDTFIDFARAKGDGNQYVEALGLLLPSSPVYPLLEGRIAHPGRTYETMAKIIETEQQKTINTLIGDRRTRIGSRLKDVTVEVKREVFAKSPLEDIFRQLIDWTTDDEVRRFYEEKLLRYCYDKLLVAPDGPQKTEMRDEVIKLANGMVIIKCPSKLAWDIALDWKDYKEISEWDVNLLREYCTHFPDSDLYKVITGFLTSELSPFPPEPTQAQNTPGNAPDQGSEVSDDDDDGGVPVAIIPFTEEDRLVMMMDGIASADSILAYRLMGEYYQHLQEWESQVELMRKALTHLQEEKKKSGISFLNTDDCYSLYLATALVYYQTPRHHAEARSLFDAVLAHDPLSTPALIGVGLIYEEEEDYAMAVDFLSRALARDLENVRIQTEAAWVRALTGDYATGRDELLECVSKLEAKKQVNKELLALTQYRVGVCIWNVDTSRSARKDRNGAYKYFLAALKTDLNLAPAYTSMGIYYADYAKDNKRARKCFQKAVELSPSEVEAAERLSRSFANAGDWDKVELITRRIINSGRVKPPPGSKRAGISWPYTALGVAGLGKQNFQEAIASFQAALRISPDDYHSWVGLGESYYNSGRFIAASKAITQAQSLEDATSGTNIDDSWFTKYLLANVKRELGDFDEAIALYRAVVETRPAEEGVVCALLQTMVESATHNIRNGVFGRAVDLVQDAVGFALRVFGTIPESFNFWKAVADACSVFSSVQSQLDKFPAQEVSDLLKASATVANEILAETDKVDPEIISPENGEDDDGLLTKLTQPLHAAILCHKRAIHSASQDNYALPVGYYNLGWAEYQTHVCLHPKNQKGYSRYLRAAVKAFKHAIELEAGNAEFWNALGVVTSRLNPEIAQHSFVRSLHLDERSAATWTNLGTLALMQNDVKLANEAFTRAQSNDPEYQYAWFGQGVVSLLLGDQEGARGLFTHSMEISDSSATPIRHQYASSTFDHLLSTTSELSITSIIQPVYALSQSQRLDPRDVAYSHLLTQFQERIGDYDRAVASLESLCSRLEDQFERTESPDVAGSFALAKADLARVYLASRQYELALESGEMALDLSSDDSGSELDAEQRRKVRLSAHLTVGMAHYFLQNPGDAVGFFESALKESDENPDAVCLLAQVLWATGTEDSREKARDKLFGVLADQPDHVPSVLLLGIISLLDEDDESLEAVVAELEGLRTSDKATDKEHSQIGAVLRSIETLRQGHTTQAAMSQAQMDAMLYPYLPHGWQSLSEMSGEEVPADMAVGVALNEIPPKGNLDTDDLAIAYSGTGRAAEAQRAIFVAPWVRDGWASLDTSVQAARARGVRC